MGLRHRLGRWLLGSAYDGTSLGRGYRQFPASGIGPSAAIAADGDVLRRRSAHLVRNNPWAYAGIDSFAANAVGTGIKPRSQHPDAAMRKRLNVLWEDWAGEAVSEGIGDVYAAQLVAARTVLETGDCFVRLRSRRLQDGFAVPLQVNLYDAAMVPYWHTVPLAGGNRILCGIEYDVLGHKVAYWMHREHPGEAGLSMRSDAELVRVPATEMLHLFAWRTAGQIRGEQALCRAVLRLYDLDEHQRTEMLRQKAAASIAAFIVTPDPDKLPAGFGEIDAGDPDSTGGATVTLEPGTIPVLGPGQDVRSHTPADLAANLDTFIDTQLRAVAQSLGVTFEQLTGDMTGVNYSSARVALLEHRRRQEPWVWNVLVHQLCQPLWRAWMDHAVMAGAIALPGYRRPTARREAQRVTWHPQGHVWVDPLKEVQAQTLAIEKRIKSRHQVIAELGFDPEVIDAEIARDPFLDVVSPEPAEPMAAAPAADPPDDESPDDAEDADETEDADDAEDEPAAARARRAVGGRR